MNARFLTAALAASFAASAASQDVVAVKAGKLITISGPTLADQVVMIENGRITQIVPAAGFEIPWTAKVVDAADKTVLPTWVVAHASAGLPSGQNESMQNVPWLSVADAVDPSAPAFEELLRNGVGTVHVMPGNSTLLGGSGLALRPFGRTVADMTLSANTGIKLSLQNQRGGRLQQIRELRRALEGVRDYLADFARRKKEFEQEQEAAAIPADKQWTEEYDRTRKAAIALVEKKAKGWLYVPTAAELPEALRLQQELDLQIVLGQNVDEGVALIARLGQPVVLDDTIEYLEEDEETKAQRKICTAKLLAAAGVPFALSLGAAGPTSYPWWQLGTCVRNGIDRRQALEALTVVPARLLGLEDQLGTVAVGMLANLQVLTGDPLQATSWVETVLLEGKVVYERRQDPKLQYLFGEEANRAEKAGGPDAPGKGDQAAASEGK
jgi:imidazolonepropionase-like amidohydrolase